MPDYVITGASQGIGLAIATAFSGEPGARVALIARNENNLQSAASRCRARGAEVAVYPCNVTDEQAVDRVAREIMERWGPPAVLVNNAGLFRPGSVRDTSAAIFREQVEVNLTSAFLVTRAFLDAMIGASRGAIFFMGSVASIRGYPKGAAYCAAKHGLLGLARALREETKGAGIRVTTILAGAVYTPSWEGVDLPEERFMPSEDIAAAVLDAYRLSDRSVVEEILIRPALGDI